MLGKRSQLLIRKVSELLVFGDGGATALLDTMESPRSPFELNSPRGLKKSYDSGGVGLGIVAALDKSQQHHEVLLPKPAVCSGAIPVQTVKRENQFPKIVAGSPEDSRPVFTHGQLYVALSRGQTIHAECRRNLSERFAKRITEGLVYRFQNFWVWHNLRGLSASRHIYKIHLQCRTKMVQYNENYFPKRDLKFDNVHEVLNQDFDERFLVDVMGEVTHVGNFSGYERNGVLTKSKDIEIESQGKKFKCFLYGQFVDELDAILNSEDDKHIVVIILLGVVTRHQGEFKLTAGLNCTTVMFNPKITQAVCYRDRLFECDAVPTQVMNVLIENVKVTEEDEFMKLFPSTTIQNLVSCRSRTIFIVHAAVKEIVSTDDWYYHDCECHTAAYSDGAQYYCLNCDKHVTPTTRYKLLIKVADNSGSATLTIFDRDGCDLIIKKSNDLLEDMEKNGCMEHPPREIKELVHREFLFRVEAKDEDGKWFKSAFNVKKICKDPEIISKFKFKVIEQNEKEGQNDIDLNADTPLKYATDSLECNLANGHLASNISDSNTPTKRHSNEGSKTKDVQESDAERLKRLKIEKI